MRGSRNHESVESRAEVLKHKVRQEQKPIPHHWLGPYTSSSTNEFLKKDQRAPGVSRRSWG